MYNIYEAWKDGGVIKGRPCYQCNMYYIQFAIWLEWF